MNINRTAAVLTRRGPDSRDITPPNEDTMAHHGPTNDAPPNSQNRASLGTSFVPLPVQQPVAVLASRLSLFNEDIINIIM